VAKKSLLRRTVSLRAIAILAATVVGGAAVAVAAPKAQAAPITFSFTAPTSLTQGCCYTALPVERTVVSLPHIGRATVSGLIEWCGISENSPCPERNGTNLTLRFVTSSGTLTLGGRNPIGDPNQTWSVTGGTGRFAGASGSGSYTYTLDEATLTRITITISGTLKLH
jgi:hypothetical protein